MGSATFSLGLRVPDHTYAFQFQYIMNPSKNSNLQYCFYFVKKLKINIYPVLCNIFIKTFYLTMETTCDDLKIAVFKNP